MAGRQSFVPATLWQDLVPGNLVPGKLVPGHLVPPGRPRHKVAQGRRISRATIYIKREMDMYIECRFEP